MNILGVELEFDFYDADQLEVYERENQKVVEQIRDPAQYEGKSASASIRIQCRIVDTFFDNVFGAGTSKRLFHGKANLRDHMEAFGIMSQSSVDARGELDAIEKKYTANRAERRQTKKNFRQAQKQRSRDYNHHAAGKGNRNT